MDLLKEMKYGIRNSRMQLHQVYFWTSTIKDWKHLLYADEFKYVIINSWKALVQKRKIIIYGFVIMPNHLHILWELIDNNGKEMPHASFNKFTSHQFLKKLRIENKELLKEFIVKNDFERSHRFWQRDPLANPY